MLKQCTLILLASLLTSYSLFAAADCMSCHQGETTMTHHDMNLLFEQAKHKDVKKKIHLKKSQ